MPVYKRSDGKWIARINYKSHLGKYKTATRGCFDTKREAQEAEANLTLELKNGLIRSSGNKLTFAQAYDEFYEWKKENIKTSTLITYPSLWAHCEPIKDIQIEKLTVPQYREFKNYLNSTKLSTDRKDKVHKLVRQLVDYSKKMYDVHCDVVDKVGGFKDPNRIRTKNVDFYTFDEFSKFISCVHDPIYHALFMVLYYQGCRIGEANGLTWNDLDFKKHTLAINKTVNTKIKGVPFTVTSTKKQASDRILPIDSDVEKELLDLKKYFSGFTNFSSDWFLFGGPRPLGESWVHVVKDKAAAEAGVKTIRVHDFRHSCASFLISLGCQPTVVQRYLGHANLSITLNTYSHMYPSDLMSAVDLMKTFKKG